MADTPTRTGDQGLHCVVVTPERAVLDEAADFVALPMFDGELGVLPGRQPLIGRLGIGELRVRKGATVRRFFVDGGFAQIRGSTVTVLTASCLATEDIKPDAIREDLNTARAGAAVTDADLDAKEKALRRARAKLRLASAKPPARSGH
jgi:F-type H+-transporting ATPase subunit epsilon